MSHDRSWVTSGVDASAYAALVRELSASNLWSLLLEVMSARAGERTASDLTRQWERDRFTEPAFVDQRTLNALDGHLLAAAEKFEALELSPLAPLGSSSVVGLTSQNRVVSALRGTEVVSDPTNAFALESARRLRNDPERVVRLATCHRCVRAQQAPKLPGFSQHFRIFCLSTAGRERGDHALLIEAFIEHITTHLAALDRLESHGYALPDRLVTILATEERAPLADRIAGAITGVSVERKPLEHRYYDGLRFMINAGSSTGTTIPLIDGGTFDWVGKLASNHRFIFVGSGMGAQLVAVLYKRKTT
jgi:hypothetical protein